MSQICDTRACISLGLKNRHGNWLCWMSTGITNVLMRRTHTQTPLAPTAYQDVLKPEAAWTAMMLVIGQESDADRLEILRLILKDTYVTTAAGQKLIDQLSHMGIYPRDVVEM